MKDLRDVKDTPCGTLGPHASAPHAPPPPPSERSSALTPPRSDAQMVWKLRFACAQRRSECAAALGSERYSSHFKNNH